MKNWTIGKRISFGFAAVLVIMLALGAFIWGRVSIVQSGTANVTNKSIPSIELLADAKEEVQRADKEMYKYVFSADPAAMKKCESDIKAAGDRITKDLEDFEKTASPDVKVLLERVRTARQAYREARDTLIVAGANSTNAEQNQALFERVQRELEPKSEAYSFIMDTCQQQVQKEGNASADAVLSAVRSTGTGLIVGILSALGMACVLGYLIIRNINLILNRVSTTLADGAGQVSSAATQVTSSSQSLAEGAGQQAASVEETSSSLEETASMTKRNSENAQKANDLGKQARTAAERGASDMQAMSSAMQSIKSSSDEVAKIIKTIDEIAFQTNILALNAAVEAARAGEAGMGFAVVADEVRNLAQRSAQAAKETSAKIEGAISSTTQGVEISGKVAEALAVIVNRVRQVDELVSEVATASKEQSAGIAQINVAVGQMDKVTQNNAASAEECAAAAEELNAQAEAMKEAVGELTRLVSGAASAPSKAGIPPQPISSPQPVRTAKHYTNGHSTFAKPAAISAESQLTISEKRQEIPLDGDFKDF